MSDLHYNYEASKAYAESLGLKWLGDDFVRNADGDAYALGFTQIQVDAAMRHHLWQVAYLFNPKSYPWYSRIALAFHFLFGGIKHVAS
jgi:hypothetical protein